MVLVFFVCCIFLGFALGFATMALLDARRHRLQCEKELETQWLFPPPQGLPGVPGQGRSLRRLMPTFHRALKKFETQTG